MSVYRNGILAFEPPSGRGVGVLFKVFLKALSLGWGSQSLMASSVRGSQIIFWAGEPYGYDLEDVEREAFGLSRNRSA